MLYSIFLEVSCTVEEEISRQKPVPDYVACQSRTMAGNQKFGPPFSPEIQQLEGWQAGDYWIAPTRL